MRVLLTWRGWLMEKVTGVFSRFFKNLEKTPVTFSISHPLQVVKRTR